MHRPLGANRQSTAWPPTARILCDLVDLSQCKFYLYDLFEGVEGVAKHTLEDHGPELFEVVKARFGDLPQVVVTKGRIPDSLSLAMPDKIAFLHVDMNNTEAEISALDALFDRVSPGGVIVLDDYGWLSYLEQHALERQWFADRGYSILELPTGQGMVIK